MALLVVIFLKTYARLKARKLRGTVMLDYNRKKSAAISRCMHAVLGQGV
jgi:hypothetical protein